MNSERRTDNEACTNPLQRSAQNGINLLINRSNSNCKPFTDTSTESSKEAPSLQSSSSATFALPASRLVRGISTATESFRELDFWLLPPFRFPAKPSIDSWKVDWVSNEKLEMLRAEINEKWWLLPPTMRSYTDTEDTANSYKESTEVRLISKCTILVPPPPHMLQQHSATGMSAVPAPSFTERLINTVGWPALTSRWRNEANKAMWKEWGAQPAATQSVPHNLLRPDSKLCLTSPYPSERTCCCGFFVL